MCTVTFVCVIMLCVLLVLLAITLLLCSTFIEYSGCCRPHIFHIAGWCGVAICGMPNA
jgi:succinate-acetate transporter protein